MGAVTRHRRIVSMTLGLCLASGIAGFGRQNPVPDMRFRASRVSQDPILVAEEVFQATVTAVEDGDTLVVKTAAGGESITIHLAGVDAPEMSQPGGSEAKAFLTQLAIGKTVTVRLQSRMERSARIEIAGSDVSAALIRGGMAWHCPRFTDDRDLTSAEADARASKRGLWSVPRPTPPWLHRGVGACWQQKKGGTARERPDFSGVWTAVAPSDLAGQKLTIKQDAATLTIEQPSDEGVESTIYKPD